MIRRRPQSVSMKPQRRRLSGIPSPSIPTDEYDVSLAELRASFLAEQARIRDAIRQAIGDDIMSIVRESLQKMNRKGRRRVLSLLDDRFGVR